MYDTLGYLKRLEAAGFPRKQAEAQVQIMAEFVNTNFATKQDLKDLRVELKHDMNQLENRIVIKLGGMMIIGFGVLAAYLKM